MWVDLKGRLLLNIGVLAVCVALGYDFGKSSSDFTVGILTGVAAWLLFFIFETLISLSKPFKVLGASLGAALFLFISTNVGAYFEIQNLFMPIAALYFILFCAVGAVAGARAAEAFRFGGDDAKTKNQTLIIDTSALIDGRVAELASLGFVSGRLVIPRFVLAETQTVADSPDQQKRARGRRGLACAEKLQGLLAVAVEISDDSVGGGREVDAKLVALAKKRGAKLVTTDYNLAKVAVVEGVEVLNVHELALAMRPVALQGETVGVVIKKLGKEPGQGVGYMDDGTMVVVENAAALLDRPVDAVVGSTIQTSSGRMIFARLANEGEAAEPRREGRGHP